MITADQCKSSITSRSQETRPQEARHVSVATVQNLVFMKTVHLNVANNVDKLNLKTIAIVTRIQTPEKVIEESKEHNTVMKFAGLQPLG